MGYKTIATVLTDPVDAPAMVQRAAQLAATFDAHLEVICAGIDYSRPELAFPEALPTLNPGALGTAREEVQALEALVAEQMTGAAPPWETHSYVVTESGLARVVTEATQFVDLTYLPLPFGEGKPTLAEVVGEAAMFSGPSPVLFADDLDVSGLSDGPVLVGWNESPEAMAAIRAALPLLQKAQVVHVAMVNPKPTGLGRSDPGGALARFLVRHGCKVELAVLSQTLPRASDELLRHARAMSCGLMVLGAYSHSRLREVVFGGATRSLLATSDIPLFMGR